MGFQPLKIGKARVHHSGDSLIAHARTALLARTTERPCLKCGSPFRSEGPHHRLCKYHRERNRAGMYHNVDYPHGTWTGGDSEGAARLEEG